MQKWLQLLPQRRRRRLLVRGASPWNSESPPRLCWRQRCKPGGGTRSKVDCEGESATWRASRKKLVCDMNARAQCALNALPDLIYVRHPNVQFLCALQFTRGGTCVWRPSAAAARRTSWRCGSVSLHAIWQLLVMSRPCSERLRVVADDRPRTERGSVEIGSGVLEQYGYN